MTDKLNLLFGEALNGMEHSSVDGVAEALMRTFIDKVQGTGDSPIAISALALSHELAMFNACILTTFTKSLQDANGDDKPDIEYASFMALQLVRATISGCDAALDKMSE